MDYYWVQMYSSAMTIERKYGKTNSYYRILDIREILLIVMLLSDEKSFSIYPLAPFDGMCVQERTVSPV